MRTSITIIVICGLLLSTPIFGKDKNKNKDKRKNYYERAVKRSEWRSYHGPPLTKSQRNEAAAADIIRVPQ